MAAKAPGQVFGWKWFTGLAAVSFSAGGAMELFMIKTGFYGKVTVIEAQRRAEIREEAHKMQEQLLELREKNKLGEGDK